MKYRLSPVHCQTLNTRCGSSGGFSVSSISVCCGSDGTVAEVGGVVEAEGRLGRCTAGELGFVAQKENRNDSPVP